MLRHKWYRWLRTIFGARSFVKHDPIKGTTYVLIYTDDENKIANLMEVMHYEEEWPVIDGPGPSYRDIIKRTD